ncbi:MAG: hypothetical protein ABI670_21910 [Chloroflexota bacterium]
MNKLRNPNVLFLLLVALFCVYGLIFIYTTSFVVQGERYFCLFDDAMISMRYAKNLADGYGLVWNPGGPAIEGYTNPLWVIFMAFWHLFPIAASKMSLAIQLSALALMAVNLYFVRKIALLVSGGSNTVALIAVALTAFYLPLNNWSLQGMEVAAITPVVSLAVWLALRIMKGAPFSPWLYVILGMGTLIRMDVAVVLVTITAFLTIADKKNRAAHIVAGLGSLLLFGGAQTAFRLAYYGDWLPNTYYLKVEGFSLWGRISRGLFVLGWFVTSMSPIVFLWTFAVVVLRRDRAVMLLAGLFFAQVAYSVYVGGDAWEWWGGSNRYISVVMPLFLTLLAYSLWVTLARAGEVVPLWHKVVDTTPLNGTIHLLILLGLLVWAAVVNFGGQAVPLPAWGLAIGIWLIVALAFRWWMQRSALRAGGNDRAATSRVKANLKAYVLPLVLLFVMIDLNTLYVPRGLLEWVLLKTPVQVHNNPGMVERAIMLKKVLKPDASYAVVWAGIMPYFVGGNAIDLLGKNDRKIAHEPMRPNLIAASPDQLFYPGHMKYDYEYSLGELKPDSIVQFWSLLPDPVEEPPGPIPSIAKPYVLDTYRRFDFGPLFIYLRKDSPNVRWDVVEQQGTLQDTALPSGAGQ